MQITVKPIIDDSRLNRGFTLISTIIVLGLLMVVALAMLSISAVETRSSQTDNSQLKAQANARVALLIALGELQEQLDPDQRISTNSAIFAADGSDKQASDQAFDSLTIDSSFDQPNILGLRDSCSDWLNELSIAETCTLCSKNKFRGMLISHPDRDMLLAEKGIETARSGSGDLETIKLYSTRADTKSLPNKSISLASSARGIQIANPSIYSSYRQVVALE